MRSSAHKDNRINDCNQANRKLEAFLQKKVNDVFFKTNNIDKTQRLEINVPSSDDTYIARVHSDHLELTAEIQTRHLDPISPKSHEPFDKENENSARIDTMIPVMSVDHFESEAGFVLQGAIIKSVACTQGRDSAWAEILNNGDGAQAPALVRVWAVSPAVSVLIELEDGRSVMLACLQGYIGHASFDEKGLMNVSYLPSSNNWRWGMVEHRLPELNRLRAEAAEATYNNAFRLESTQAARNLAEKIRVGKSVDPSLGLYAATAFAQASLEDKVQSVMNYMRDDLGADLFDVRLLASRRPEQPKSSAHYPVTPLCPMLTQNWHLLNTRGVQLPTALEKAKPYLSDSLWTTFAAEATPGLMQAFNSGELE